MMSRHRIAVFDLDDTLYHEHDYVVSAFSYIARDLSHRYALDYDAMVGTMMSAGNPFDNLLRYISHTATPITEDVAWLVDTYRNHPPTLELSADAKRTIEMLQAHNVELAIITAGRVTSQNNKIKALGLNRIVKPENIIVSEAVEGDKLSGKPFELLVAQAGPDNEYTYIGDNPAKDFVWPNRHNWTTIALADTSGINIHRQEWDKFPAINRPRHIVDNLLDIVPLIVKPNIVN